MNRFEVEYLSDAIAFLETIDSKAAKKLIYNISKSQEMNDPKTFKKLTNSNIWEFRAEWNNNQYRLFAVWDNRENTVVVCTHGTLKKTQKTPQKEIDKAEQIRLENNI